MFTPARGSRRGSVSAVGFRFAQGMHRRRSKGLRAMMGGRRALREGTCYADRPTQSPALAAAGCGRGRLRQGQAAGSAHAAGLSGHRCHRGKWIYNGAGRVREGWPCVQARTMQPGPHILKRRRRAWRGSSVPLCWRCASRGGYAGGVQRPKCIPWRQVPQPLVSFWWVLLLPKEHFGFSRHVCPEVESCLRGQHARRLHFAIRCHARHH